jgi:TP901 family phage tail tape measure protein
VGTVATLQVRVTAIVTDFEKAMASIEKSAARTGAKFQSIGSDLTKGITLPLVAIGGLSVKAAMDFESSFAGVRKTVDGVVDAGGELTAFGEKLQADFRALAKEIPVSVNELNKIGESAGQLGIKSENIISFTKTIAAMGVATNLSTEQAADGMARFANITQMPQENISNLASTIVFLGGKLAATESEILEFGLRVAGAGEIAGLTEANILAIGAAFSSVGIEAEAGGTAVQKALLEMNAAAQSGKGLAGFGAGAGMSGDAFGDLFKENPEEAFAKFVEGIGAAGKEGSKLLEGAGITDSRSIRAFLSLGAAGDLIRESFKMANDEFVRNTALTKEAEQRNRTFESQLVIFKNKLDDVRITIGEALIPALLRMAPAIETVLNAVAGIVVGFSKMPEPLQTAVIGFAALAAAVGPIAYVFGTLLSTGAGVIAFFRTTIGLFGAGGMAGAVARLAPLVAGLGPTIATVGTAIGAFLTAPITLAIAGIAALAAGIYKLYTMLHTDLSPALAQAQSGLTGFHKIQSDAFDTLSSFKPALDPGEYLDNLTPRAGATGAGAVSGQSGVVKSTAEITDFERAVRSLTERLSGSTLIDTAKQWISAIERIGGIGALTHDELRTFTEDITAAVEKMRLLGQVIPRTWELIADSAERLAGLQADRDAIGDSLGRGFEMNRQQLLLPGGSGDTAGLMGATPGAMVSQNIGPMTTAGVTMGGAFKEGWSNAMAGMPQVVMNALMGGGNIGLSVGGLIGTELLGGLVNKLGPALQSGLSNVFGKSIGGALSSVIPGIGGILGSMIGPLIGKLASKIWGGIQSAFGTDEEAKNVNPARDAFLSQFGGAGTGEGSGFSNLAAQLTGATGQEGGGALFQALTGADTMEEFTSAVSNINQQLSSSSAGVEEITRANDTFNMSLTGSDEAIAQLGQTQLTVTEMMLQGFGALISKLDELIARISTAGAAASALSSMTIPDGPSGLSAAIESGWRVTDGEVPGAGIEEVPSFANEGMVRRPTLAMIGDANEPEFVLRKSTVEGLAGGSAAGGVNVTVNVNARYVTTEDTWIREQVTQGVLGAIRGGGSAFRTFEHLVGSAARA